MNLGLSTYTLPQDFVRYLVKIHQDMSVSLTILLSVGPRHHRDIYRIEMTSHLSTCNTKLREFTQHLTLLVKNGPPELPGLGNISLNK